MGGSGGVACGSAPAAAGGLVESSAGADTPWVCEHRWTGVANMVGWRKAAGSSLVSNFQALGGDTIAFCRGSSACVALNRQSTATWSVTLKFSVPAGKYCDVIQSDDISNCPQVEVVSDGSVSLQVPPLGAVAVHVGKRLSTFEV